MILDTYTKVGGWAVGVVEVGLHESARCISVSVHTPGANGLLMSVYVSSIEQLLIVSLSPLMAGLMCSYTSFLFSVFAFV